MSPFFDPILAYDISVMERLAAQVRFLKEEAKKMYVSTKHDLDFRWELFIKTPVELRDVNPRQSHFSEFEEKYGQIDWLSFDPSTTTLDFDEVVKSIQESFDTGWEDDVFSLENLSEFKEAILKQGFHSFTLRWA